MEARSEPGCLAEERQVPDRSVDTYRQERYVVTMRRGYSYVGVLCMAMAIASAGLGGCSAKDDEPAEDDRQAVQTPTEAEGAGRRSRLGGRQLDFDANDGANATGGVMNEPNVQALSLAPPEHGTAVAAAPRSRAVADQAADGLLAEWQAMDDPAEKVAFLESLRQIGQEPPRELLPIIREALEDPDPDVVLAASGILADYTSGEVLPLVERALMSPNEEVRMNALEPLEHISDPRVAGLYVTALEDPSEDVRSLALEKIGEREDQVQLDVLATAMRSSFEDVRYEALSLLEFRGDHASVPVIIEGLRSQDTEFREAVHAALNFLFDQEFDSYDQAAAWWRQNSSRYDEDLVEK